MRFMLYAFFGILYIACVAVVVRGEMKERRRRWGGQDPPKGD